MNNAVSDAVKDGVFHLSRLFDINISIFDIRLKQLDGENPFCTQVCNKKCNYTNTHLYGSYEAARWGGKYIYYCPQGLVFLAVATQNEVGIMEKSFILGPSTIGDEPCVGLPHFLPHNMEHFSEVAVAMFGGKKAVKTEKILNEICKIQDGTPEAERTKYPLELEKELQNAIINQDKTASGELLNRLLGHIYFHSNNDFKKIKTRVSEVLVLLSRSAIESGGNVRDVLEYNNFLFQDIDRFTTLEQFGAWLTDVLTQFFSYSFEFCDVKHTDTIYKITAFINDHYNEKLALEDIAKHVHLSKSYLSKIFKQETNCSLVEYINRIRVEKSKALLADRSLSLVHVALEIGFEDQSYYTKVFKKIVGISPGKYREKLGKS